jgi:putative CocE/NonD family hydrolase
MRGRLKSERQTFSTTRSNQDMRDSIAMFSGSRADRSRRTACAGRAAMGAIILIVGLLFARGGAAALAHSSADPVVPQGAFAYRLDPNVFIPMRDGVRLAADLYFPQGPAGEKYPIVLIRTPYGNVPGNNLNEAAVHVFASHGFVVAVQDKRGKYRSEGIYTVSGGDANDGYDTVDWLSKQPWSNGRIGTYGCSYLGDIQIFLAQSRHPALKAMIPQASGSAVGSAGRLYRYFGVREGGAVSWASAIGWFARFGAKVKLPASVDHSAYDADNAWNQPPKPPVIDYQRAWHHLPMKDALRAQGAASSDFEDNITKPPTDPYWAQFPYMTENYVSDVPALFVNSWYDFGADVTLFEFNWYQTRSASQKARDNQYVILSPGVHCSSERGASAEMVVGTRPMGDSRFDYWHTYLTWFDRWLREDSAARDRIKTWPKVRYYLMGANAWKEANNWPVEGAHKVKFYLSGKRRANSVFGDGQLREQAPRGGANADTFRYNPAVPVPSLGGALCCTGTADMPAGSVDQRPVEARDDVLVYTSAPLTTGVDVTGQVDATLFVSSSAIDTDFTAKLVDVYPDGRAFNVLEGILRARYREGQEKEIWMHAGEIYPLRISLGATSNYFGPDHRIRLEVSSSNFPEFDRNLNIGGNNAEGTRWVTATNTVHHSPRYPSHLVLPVVETQARGASQQHE